MGLRKISVEKFRCLDSIEFSPDPHINLITGENGAGKTSVLEALFFLGRGRSFRAGQTQGLIQNGADGFTIYSEIQRQAVEFRVGIRVDRNAGREIHVDGEAGGQTTDLIEAFPVQIIDPSVHELVQGGPQVRRQFIDWGVFHVKHDFLPAWRRYRRALQQRNTALRQQADPAAVDAWDAELLPAASVVDACRREYLESFEPVFGKISADLLGAPGEYRYLPGWSASESFETALAASRDRDRQYGTTHSGPHRAELVLEIDGHAARHRLSRGQQKLLGTALVLAQSELVAEETGRDVALLVDEPAAELDDHHLKQLMAALEKQQLQLFLTALRDSALPLAGSPALFHVKHKILSPLL